MEDFNDYIERAACGGESRELGALGNCMITLNETAVSALAVAVRDRLVVMREVLRAVSNGDGRTNAVKDLKAAYEAEISALANVYDQLHAPVDA